MFDCKSTAKTYKMSNCHTFNKKIKSICMSKPMAIKKINKILRLLRYSLPIFGTVFYSSPKGYNYKN